MVDPFESVETEPIVESYKTPIELAALALRASGESAQITDLGASSAGINLNLTAESREQLLDQFGQTLISLGFK